ncbi:Bug family tripartite tricarboxylate transporter substrate binding protein [Cupriavidus basilensis]|uniref:Bug family tripartite tricarboxylate transporter substrate binding protein n=1 Tax=Cupriavidus basilensis TaxID=68895 RepID=UPI001F355EAE|nr:tripartite tricarboxylate transporter substrate binding protein [Cupriavidus basilensis]
MVVPFAAGTGTDAVARIIGQAISKNANVPVVVDNFPGANGFIGAKEVARAPADGYTILMTTSTTHAANAAMFKQLPYDPIKDFEPVGKTGDATLALVVRSDSPYRNISSFANTIRSKKSLTFGASSASTRIAAEMLKLRLKGNLLYVPYRSSPQALTDLLGGQFDFMTCDLSPALPLIRAGKLTALAVTSKQRDSHLPNVPTIAESGLPGFELTAWSAAFAPARTPKAVIDRLNFFLRQALEDEGVRKQMIEKGVTPSYSTSEELGIFVVQESKKWAQVVRDAGISPE